tara:strand:- start:1669 stop:2097 length:429 start_codon:yes stop_codon:yes gene_type:complete
MADVNAAILERLEAVVTSLQENSIKMGQILAVHQEKLEQQEKADDILFEKIDHIHKDLHVKTDEIKKGCERDILMVKGQIEAVEKKVYVMLGAVAVISLTINPSVIKMLRPLLSASRPATIERTVPISDELSRSEIRYASVE